MRSTLVLASALALAACSSTAPLQGSDPAAACAALTAPMPASNIGLPTT
ncbi:MAG: hypothetical protein H7Z15_12795, partial [Rhizobacter sp.]|nr:hypothetical protein [Rhizobacter sp.]